jgi:hypothetical protein
MILNGKVINYKFLELIKIYNFYFGHFSIWICLNNLKFWILDELQFSSIFKFFSSKFMWNLLVFSPRYSYYVIKLECNIWALWDCEQLKAEQALSTSWQHQVSVWRICYFSSFANRRLDIAHEQSIRLWSFHAHSRHCSRSFTIKACSHVILDHP